MVQYRKKRTVRKRPVNPSVRRNRRLKRKYNRKVKKYNTKPHLTVQKLKAFTPDVMLTKLKSTYTINNYRMDNIGDAQLFSMNQPSNNATSASGRGIYICLNPRPNEGRFMHTGSSAYGNYDPNGIAMIKFEGYPAEALAVNYNSYRPYGMKVKLTFFPADTPEVGASGLTGPTNLIGAAIPAPYRITTLPFQMKDTTRGGYWNGSNEPVALSSSTIGMAKYGKSYVVPASGGKSGKVITQYYDCAKVYGMTRNQWMVSDSTKCQVKSVDDVNLPNPLLEAFLQVVVAEFNTDPTQTRYCNVQVDVVAYGRWEGTSIQTVI